MPQGDVLEHLRHQLAVVCDLFSGLTELQAGHRYAPGKWSLRELLRHCSDAERILANRALRIGRGDQTPNPGFDEDAYVATCGAEGCSIAALLAEWRTVREASLGLFQNLPEAAWARRGVANGFALTTRCFPFVGYGHTALHLAVIKERYLS